MGLCCTVRGCGGALERRDGGFVCGAGHRFDVARSGYVNLLQPQDRRSLAPGDSREAVRARRALLDAGFGAALLRALGDVIERAALPPRARAADLGCGEGHFLGALAGRWNLEATGVDLSTSAIDAAAKRHRECRWVVANADRRLPFLDGALDLVLSIDGRRNPAECARVLARGGVLVVAVPADDDLCELRERILGAAHASGRARAIERECAPAFVLEEHVVARERRRLDARGLGDLALATYRCARHAQQRALAEVDALEVTTSHDVLRLRRA